MIPMALNKAWRLAMSIVSPEGQTILKGYGFEAATTSKYEKIRIIDHQEKTPKNPVITHLRKINTSPII